MDTYHRKFHITDHALQRIRERLTDKQKAVYRNDEDLGNAIDQATAGGIACDDYENITDDGVAAMIVELGQNSDFPDMWALVKPELKVKPGQPDRYVSTCLTTEQVNRSKSDSGRNWGHKTSASSKLGSLGDKLAPVAAALKETSKPAQLKVSPKEPAPPESDLILGLDLDKLDKRLVVSPDGNKRVMSKAEASKLLVLFISEGGRQEDVQVFKLGWIKVEKKVKMTVEVEV
jgi:hypothetical protein